MKAVRWSASFLPKLTAIAAVMSLIASARSSGSSNWSTACLTVRVRRFLGLIMHNVTPKGSTWSAGAGAGAGAPAATGCGAAAAAAPKGWGAFAGLTRRPSAWMAGSSCARAGHSWMTRRSETWSQTSSLASMPAPQMPAFAKKSGGSESSKTFAPSSAYSQCSGFTRPDRDILRRGDCGSAGFAFARVCGRMHDGGLAKGVAHPRIA